MKLHVLVTLILLTILSSSAYAAKSLLVTQEAAVTSFYLAKDLTGFVKIKYCSSCVAKHFKITSDIKAYLNNKQVSLSQYVLSKTKPNSIVLERKSGKFVAMKWFSKRK